MNPPLIVGVDPGAAQTGIVARRGDELLASAVVERDGKVGRDTVVDPDYLLLVLDAVEDIRRRVHVATGAHPIVAVEAYRPPSPHVRMVGVAAAISTGVTIGAVVGRYAPDVITVPPSGFGLLPRHCYPELLWGPRESAGKGRLRHCRAAWDLSGAAALWWRLSTARRSA